MASNCCRANLTVGEDCCCKCCQSTKCFTKQVYGVCRMDMPCVKWPKPRPPSFYKMFRHHKNPDLPWLDWHHRPLITYDSTNVNYYHYQLKRRMPYMPDVYFHDLPEDAKNVI